MCGAMGSLAVKGGEKNVLPTFPSWQRQRALLRRFSHCQQDPERRKQCLCTVPTQRVTQSQLGKEAAKCSNGEFQVNALCFHINSWFALKSLKNNPLKNSGGTGENYQVTRLLFHNKVLVLLSDHVTGIHSLRLLHDVLSYPFLQVRV